jgi:beta-phosphoglucomutase
VSLTPVVFDMDGVLVDSERVYEAAFRVYMTRTGRPDLADGFAATLGRRLDDFLPELAAELGRPREEVADGLRAAEREQEARDGLQPMAHVHAVLDRLARDGRPVALASSSRRRTIDRVLAALDVADAFGAIAGGDEVLRGKPAPDVYLLAAERLAVPPGACVAIEDSPTGAASARAAGMTTIAVRQAHTRGLDLSAAHHVVDDLREAATIVVERDRQAPQ